MATTTTKKIKSCEPSSTSSSPFTVLDLCEEPDKEIETQSQLLDELVDHPAKPDFNSVGDLSEDELSSSSFNLKKVYSKLSSNRRQSKTECLKKPANKSYSKKTANRSSGTYPDQILLNAISSHHHGGCVCCLIHEKYLKCFKFQSQQQQQQPNLNLIELEFLNYFIQINNLTRSKNSNAAKANKSVNEANVNLIQNRSETNLAEVGSHLKHVLALICCCFFE